MNIALILSGGTGTRLGADIPKQYIKINERMIIYYCLETFCRCDAIDKIWVVANADWYEAIRKEMQNIVESSPVASELQENARKLKGFSQPGETRQLSIYNGLKDIAEFASEDDIIIIHDAARPLVTEMTIRELLAQATAHDGAIPVLPMKDTVYFSEDGQCITSLLERKCVFAGQAPESFKFDKYYEANKRLLPDEIYRINGSTEPAILAGLDIAMIDGDESNFKITTKQDLERFEQMLEKNNWKL